MAAIKNNLPAPTPGITKDEVELGFELWELYDFSCLPTLEDVRHLYPIPNVVLLIREILDWSENGNR